MAELWYLLDESGNKTGRIHERSKRMKKGEYHLVVYVWIINNKGEYLISKRTPNKSFPNMWECTGGNAIAGDDSLTTVIKEAKEELGVVLKPENGYLFTQYKHCHDEYCDGALVDVWIFRQEVDISSVVFQSDETCDAMWVTKEQLSRMIEEKIFITWGMFSYIDIDEFFEKCTK